MDRVRVDSASYGSVKCCCCRKHISRTYFMARCFDLHARLIAC